MYQERANPNLSIQEYLQQDPIRSDIAQQLLDIQTKLTTTIGTAREIVGLTETQLRYWETKGILDPRRPNDGKGQRQYSLEDLRRLVVTHHLLLHGYGLTDIAAYMRSIDAVSLQELGDQDRRRAALPRRTISQHLTDLEDAPFWKGFLAHATYLALTLLRGDAAFGSAGLCVPLESPPNLSAQPIGVPERLPELGESLVVWSEDGAPFCTFVTAHPALDVPERYTLRALWADADAAPAGSPLAYLITEKKITSLLPTSDRDKGGGSPQDVAIRLLAFLRDTHAEWHAHLTTPYVTFDAPSIDNPAFSLRLLNRMAELVMQLGAPCWRYSCILLPDNIEQPLLERGLVVRGKSRDARHALGITSVTPAGQPRTNTGISLRAYQSDHMVYVPYVADDDPLIAYRELEDDVRSAIAVPIEGPVGQASGTIYVAADAPDAFAAPADQLLLRLISRILGELLQTYGARRQTRESISALIADPTSLDSFFRDFRTETQQIKDLDASLEHYASNQPETSLSALSLIAVDVDDLVHIARDYGDPAARSIVRHVGRKIQQWLRGRSLEEGAGHLYRIFGDRFYVVAQDIHDPDPDKFAEGLWAAMQQHPYRIGVSTLTPSQSSPGSTQSIKITVRVGVSTYPGAKLHQLLKEQTAKLGRDDPNSLNHAIANVRARLSGVLEETLNFGKQIGGNVVCRYDPIAGEFEVLDGSHTHDEETEREDIPTGQDGADPRVPVAAD